MASKFHWDPAFSVGNKELDIQHMALFSIENTLHVELSEEQIQLVIVELHRFMMIHFDTEEKFMQRIKYPHLDEHKKLHNQLTNKLRQLDQLDFTGEGSLGSLRKFLSEWIADHILYEDMRYAKFYKQQRKESQQAKNDADSALETT